MKKLIFIGLTLVVLFACHEQFETKSKGSFDKTTGDRITNTDAERWIERYSKLQDAAKLQSGGYNIGEEQLNVMLKTENVQGIGLHHALDNKGDHHILAIPILPEFGSAKYIVDANTNTTISAEISQKWIAEYENKNPKSIWYHQFGVEIFDEIKSNQNFKGFEIQPAINDEMIPQLILLVKKHDASGREMGDGAAYDKSNAGGGTPP